MPETQFTKSPNPIRSFDPFWSCERAALTRLRPHAVIAKSHEPYVFAALEHETRYTKKLTKGKES